MRQCHNLVDNLVNGLDGVCGGADHGGADQGPWCRPRTGLAMSLMDSFIYMLPKIDLFLHHTIRSSSSRSHQLPSVMTSATTGSPRQQRWHPSSWLSSGICEARARRSGAQHCGGPLSLDRGVGREATLYHGVGCGCHGGCPARRPRASRVGTTS